MANDMNLDYRQSPFLAAAVPTRHNYSMRQFADSRGVSVRTMYRELEDGELETTKIRGRRIVTPAQQDRYDERKRLQAEGG